MNKPMDVVGLASVTKGPLKLAIVGLDLGLQAHNY